MTVIRGRLRVAEMIAVCRRTGIGTTSAVHKHTSLGFLIILLGGADEVAQRLLGPDGVKLLELR